MLPSAQVLAQLRFHLPATYAFHRRGPCRALGARDMGHMQLHLDQSAVCATQSMASFYTSSVGDGVLAQLLFNVPCAHPVRSASDGQGTSGTVSAGSSACMWLHVL